MTKGYTGISFPFRIGNKGGVVLSSTNRFEVPHINESIIQILGTMKGERVMELDFGSDLDTQIFEPNDITTHNLIRYQVVDELTRQEPRISVVEDDVMIVSEEGRIYALIDYEVISYNSRHSVKVEMKEV